MNLMAFVRKMLHGKSSSGDGGLQFAGAQYRVGELVGGSFEVRGVLGVGGFSVVYLVRERATGSLYALKTLRDEFLDDRRTREQFRKEAKLWVDLDRHPHIVRAHFIAELDRRLFIGMEYVPGDQLGRNTLEGFMGKDPPSLSQSIRWAIQVCRGMEYARSRGVRCHRDIKPANIMVTPERTVKITDFGFAGVIDATREASAPRTAGRRPAGVERAGFGTPSYMPPEQFRNALSCDERSDIYSFGIVLYQLAARGKLPFSATARKHLFGDDVAAMWGEMHRMHRESPVPRLASPLFPLIQRCLQKEQSARYQTFGALRADLEDLLKKQTGDEAEHASTGEELRAWELYNKAFSLSSLGNYQEAIRCYDRVTEIEPENADAWNNKGACYQKLQQGDDAVRCYARAIAARPDDASAYRNRGASLYTLGRFEDSLKDLDHAIELESGNATVWLHKALVEERLRRNAHAVRSFTRFLALAPPQAENQKEYARRRIEDLQRWLKEHE